jgi:death-on-curing protein
LTRFYYYYDLTYEDIVNAHNDVQILSHLGDRIERGIQKPGLLESIAKRPSQRYYNHEQFRGIYSKCASLIEAIIQWHPFTDGNKRTALVAAHMYMNKNSHYLVTPFDSPRFTVLVAQKKKSFDDIRNWVQTHTAKNHKEYTRKYNKYVKEPGRKILALYKSGNAAKIKRANTITDRWLAIDIYPEYKMEYPQTVLFLGELINKYSSSPNAAPPPPPPPSSSE